MAVSGPTLLALLLPSPDGATGQQASRFCTSQTLEMFQDVVEVQNTDIVRTQWMRNLREKVFRSEEEYQDFFTEIVIPAEIPIPFKAGLSSDEANAYWRDYIESQNFDQYVRRLRDLEIRSLSDLAVPFVVGCLTAEHKGLFAWLSRGANPTVVILNLDYRPTGQAPETVRIQVAPSDAIALTSNLPNGRVRSGTIELEVPAGKSERLSFRRTDLDSDVNFDVQAESHSVIWFGLSDLLPASVLSALELESRNRV